MSANLKTVGHKGGNRSKKSGDKKPGKESAAKIAANRRDTSRGYDEGDARPNTSASNGTSANDDPGIKEKVRQICEMTHKSEDKVLYALHDCDNDVETAINILYEKSNIQNEWETINKRKKNSHRHVTGGDAGWNENAANGRGNADANRRRGGPRRLPSHAWRPHERMENDRGAFGHRARGAMHGGSGTGRGCTGDRFPPRGNRASGGGSIGKKPMETWANVTTNYEEDNWDEWSAEEYTGSLMETKVFTSKVQ